MLPVTAQSQLSDQKDTARVRRQQDSALSSRQNLNVFITGTFANNGFYAKSFDRHLSLLGLQYRLLLKRNRIIALSYIPEITPIALLAQPSIRGFAVRRSIPWLPVHNTYMGSVAIPLLLNWFSGLSGRCNFSWMHREDFCISVARFHLCRRHGSISLQTSVLALKLF
jgi:hypothetical protein